MGSCITTYNNVPWAYLEASKTKEIVYHSDETVLIEELVDILNRHFAIQSPVGHGMDLFQKSVHFT